MKALKTDYANFREVLRTMPPEPYHTPADIDCRMTPNVGALMAAALAAAGSYAIVTGGRVPCETDYLAASGAAFSAVFSEKARGAAVPRLCPECRKARTKESTRRCKARMRSQTAHKAMLARLAARDAAYERGGHAAESRVTVRDGLRVETRGRVCGSPVGGRRVEV